jgi:Big-like domain-containing protein
MKWPRIITTDRRRTLRAGLTSIITAGVFATAAAPAALAQLNRVGPVGPLGYPSWYQDKTGLTLEFCDNQTAAELAGGWCVLLPPDIPNGAPETRSGSPVNFADEHFYYLLNAGGAGVPIPGQPGQSTRVLLVTAIEAAFGGGPVKAGDEVVFARIRVRVDTLPYSGTYTVYTPFGKRVFEDQVAGERLFATEDVGLAVGNFQEALNGSVHPFVVPSSTPGGAELPPVSAANQAPDQDPAHFAGGGPTPYPANGRRYIADPARLGPVTGSLADFSGDGISNANVFRIDIDGPDVPNGHVVLYETSDFSLAGRIFEGSIPGEVMLDRASYARGANSGENVGKVDIYATATPITVGRIPGTPPTTPIPANLVYYNAACVPTLDAAGKLGEPYGRPGNAAMVQMLNSGKTFFAQHGALPDGMAGCLEANATTTNGQATTVYTPVLLTDQVTISQADFDAAAQTLTVKAFSSDASVRIDDGSLVQTLTVPGFGNLVSGQLVVDHVLAAPATITVTSSGGGANTRQIATGTPAAVGGGGTTGGGTGGDGGGTTPPAPVTPLANNIGAATVEEGPVAITLTTDPDATITLVSTGVLGTAVVSDLGTVTFTPNTNANGTDSFAYTITKAGLTSNTATVTVSIAPVNDTPTAVADVVSAVAGVAANLNLLGNDVDPDGPADLVKIVVDAADPRLGAVSVAGGVATFTAQALPAGSAPVTVALSYHAVDKAGAESPSVTSTVRLFATETIAPSRWQYTTSQNRWVVTGTVTPNMGQSMTISYASGTYNVWNTATSRFVCTAAAGRAVGTAATDGTGTWSFDQPGTPSNSIFNPTNSNNNASSPDGRNKTSFWCATPTLRITSSVTGASVTTTAVQVK